MNDTLAARFNPRSPEFRADPYPIYRYLRTHRPIYYRAEQEDWILTRYADVVEVLKSPDFGRSESRRTPSVTGTNDRPVNRLLSIRRESNNLMGLWLVLTNPPDHTRIRRLLLRAFTQSRINALQASIQAQVDSYIDQAVERGKLDVIGDLAYPLMLDLNCREILGIPQQNWHRNFKQWTENMSLVADLDITPITHERGMLVIAGLAEFFRNRIAECRAGSEPADNLIGMLIEEAGQLSEEELLANCIMMFTVGHSSTVNLIGIGVLTLLRHPAQLRLLVADPSLIETAISEVLRYDSPVQGVSRTALCDVELADTKIRRDERVVCLIGAANRDPARFPEPDKFDIRRRPNPHLSFGYGIHTCIGKNLSQLVAKLVVGTLVRRLPGLSLATDAVEWEDSFLGHGLKALPVVF
ncbi:cytochrome P450 [Candidatus Thiosymbion oneisti]|uniref:cytochrome P450 n=1 Tax=Candidatus Thiosymbion oneisti TaxID=589554 RepID=UPI000B299DC3|nr:cytochrome P450 [Candidatus Thiosymbion oneisti]